MESGHLAALKAVVEKLEKDPTLIYDKELSFFKEFLLSWGAKIPAVGSATSTKGAPEASAGPQKVDPPKEEPVEEEAESEEEAEEEEEPDPERLAQDSPPFPEKSPVGELELSDEQMDKQADAKQAAAEAIEDGELEKALEQYTIAIKIGNASAMMYAKRAEILLKLKRPCASIADCDAAIEINQDSAKAYRIRGKAYRKIGNWELAHKDLSMGQKLDFDDDTVEVQRLVAERWKKISERQTRQRIKREAKEKKRKEADMKRRKEEAKRAYEEANRSSGSAGGGCGGFPGFPGMPGGMGGMPGGMGGMPGMPGMPGGMDPNLLQGLMSDPELMQAFNNPKVAAAMQDLMSNPANIGKYQSDPEIMRLITKISGAFGGMMGGAGEAGGGCGASSAPQNTSGPTVEECDDVD